MDAGVAHLPLQHLNLESCAITDAGLAHLCQLPLQDLNLSLLVPDSRILGHI